MLEVVARNSFENRSSERSVTLNVLKGYSGRVMSVNARYMDLFDQYILAENVLNDKISAEIKAYREYQEANMNVEKIRQEMKELENKVDLYRRKAK